MKLTDKSYVTTRIHFLDVVYILWDWRGWRHTSGVAPCKLTYRDPSGKAFTHGVLNEVTYRDTGLRFYLDLDCVTLRREHPEPIYRPGCLAWWVLGLLCGRLRRRLQGHGNVVQ